MNCFPVLTPQNGFCLQNTLLSFTVSGVFKEGEWFSHQDLRFLFLIQHNIKSDDFVAYVSFVCFSVVLDGKSRESTMAFSRVFVTVPAGNSG